MIWLNPRGGVSTHSRPKAAGDCSQVLAVSRAVSTHSRPKAAGSEMLLGALGLIVSTHSRPKAAGWLNDTNTGKTLGFNTQPPEGGWLKM